MRYVIHEGGNVLQLPWSTQTNGRTDNYHVNYAEHHKRRTLEIEKHIDTQSYDWNGFYQGLNGEADDKPIVMATDDELVTHLIGEGSLIQYVIIHVKRPGSGTITPFLELADGTIMDIKDAAGGEAYTVDLSQVGHHMGFVDGSTTVLPAVQKTAKHTVVLDNFAIDGKTYNGVKATFALPIPPSVPAFLPYMTTDNGVIGFKFTAEKDDNDDDLPFDACVGIYVALKDFWDEHKCECAPTPCETEYPSPVCTPNKKPADGDNSKKQA